MKYDILNIADVRKTERSFLVAMPAFAYESEVHPLLEGELDAYEEAVLKLVSVDLSANGIAHVMNASESLIDEVLSNLECRRMVKKTAGNPWRLDNDGIEYLKGQVRERPSDDSMYGYFFVNPIKRDVMPFFHYGDLSRATLFNKGKQNEGEPILLITRENDLDSTFEDFHRLRNYDVEKAYFSYVKCDRILTRRVNNEITLEEAKSEVATIEAFESQFDDLDSLDEEDFEVIPVSEEKVEKVEPLKSFGNKTIIRLMRGKPGINPKKVFLTMRVVIDPSTSEGFRVTSPFNMKGIDDKYYLRQMLWLMGQSDVRIRRINDEESEGKSLKDFMNHEILQLCESFNADKLNFVHFAQREMPHLVANQNQFRELYDTLAGEYGLMQRNPDLRGQKNIIRDLGSDVVESLLNHFFKEKDSTEMRNVSNLALKDLKRLDGEIFLRQMLNRTFLSESDVAGWSVKNLDKPIRNMANSHGNGAWEKLVNILVLNYYNPTDFTKRLLEADNISTMVRRIGTLNRVRNLVTHTKTGANARIFGQQDYQEYKDNIFAFVDGVVAALGKN